MRVPPLPILGHFYCLLSIPGCPPLLSRADGASLSVALNRRQSVCKPQVVLSPQKLQYYLRSCSITRGDDNPCEAQVMLPPEKLCSDVICPDTPVEAKAVLIDLMRCLYISDEVHHTKHPLLGEALLDLLRYLVSQMSNAPTETFSRYYVHPLVGGYELPRLLNGHWVPLLIATLTPDILGATPLSELKLVCNSLVDRVIDVLNECTLEPRNAAAFMRVIEGARRLQVSGASIITDKAMLHAASYHEEPAPAKPHGGKAGEEEERGAADKVTEKEVLRTFAAVFLEIADPVRAKPGGEEPDHDENGGGLPKREELMRLCEAFHATRGGEDAVEAASKIGGWAGVGKAPQVSKV